MRLMGGGSSGCRERHQLANVHESADRGDDSQSDRRELPPDRPNGEPLARNRLAPASCGYVPAMIDLIPGHGWLDLAGVVIVVLVAFGVFFLGLAATVARVRD
jgi:hypothetical protein